MLKSTSILTLLLALGVFSAGPILTNFAPLGATAAYAESDDDSRSGIEDDDDDDSHQATMRIPTIIKPLGRVLVRFLMKVRFLI